MVSFAITSGYYNPVHPGHIECFELSKKYGDKLFVIINNDRQAKLKRNTESFQDQDYRSVIIKNFRQVDGIILSIDEDLTVCKTLEMIINDLRGMYPDCEITFTKGGDRFGNEVPEAAVCRKHNVQLVDGLGAKTHSSSDYVKKIGKM